MNPTVPKDDLSNHIASLLRNLLGDRDNGELLTQVNKNVEHHPREFSAALQQVYQTPGTNTLPDSDKVGTVPPGVWQNCIDNQQCKPTSIREANSLYDLIEIVNEARRSGQTVRVVGAGHSFSNVAITYSQGDQQKSILVKPTGLKGVNHIGKSFLRTGVDASKLVIVESGTTIRELNEQLDKMGLALINMGAYDHQTIAGAISTGTHGTGVGLGPIGSSVRSLVVVSEMGKIYHIEPTNGITDPVKFNASWSDIILKQDDDWFQSNVLAMGCTGLIYSYTLEVMPAYLLHEDRTASDWDTLKSQFIPPSPGQLPPILTKYRHYEIDVNPYTLLGKRLCIETKRNIVQGKPSKTGRGFYNWLTGLLAQWSLAQIVLVDALNDFPSFLIPRSINSGLKTLEDKGYVDKSFKVLDLGADNSVPAYAIELSFDIVNMVANLDKLFDLFVKYSTASTPWWIAGPVGIRFVQASDAYLAPQYGRVTVMAELDMLVGINNGEELLRAIQKDMTSDTSVRVHWGLELDTLDGTQAEKMYPQYNRWLAVYREMNTTGMFNSPFTDRLGISVKRPMMQALAQSVSSVTLPSWSCRVI